MYCRASENLDDMSGSFEPPAVASFDVPNYLKRRDTLCHGVISRPDVVRDVTHQQR